MAPWVVLIAGLAGGALGVPLVTIAERMLRIPRRFSWRVRAVAMVASGALVALVFWKFGRGWETPAYLYLALTAVVLSIVDLAEKRLPNALVYPSMVVMPVLLTLAAAATGNWQSLLGAFVGGAALFVFYFLLALISPGGIGMGDVKLALVIGLALGYLGWTPFLGGAVGAFIIGSVFSIVALALRRVTLRGSLPFGPSMLAGAFLGVILA